MSYSPITDFLALLRLASDGAHVERMPGLDFVAAAMQRVGIISLWTGQEAPTANQSSTVWLKPALPSWTAEGVVFLYDADTASFVTATPALWSALLTAPADYVFQRVTSGADTINGRTTLLAVQRTIPAPATTALMLPSVAARVGRPLRIADWSTVSADHGIALSTPDGASIMRQSLWTIFSTPSQLTGVTLHPSTDLNGWVIAP